MVQRYRPSFIVILIIIMVTTVDAQAQSMPSSLAGSASTAIAVSENNVINILGLDPTAFPKIKINVFIDKFCAMAGNLKKENFKVKENGKDMAINNLYFTGNASGQKLDLAVVFDDTGSMSEEIGAMKSKVKDLTDTLKASRLEANYSLVSFKDSVSVKTKWMNDPVEFKKYVDALAADDGGDEPEVSLDAIEAVLSMGFRADAQKVMLVITDADAHHKNDSSVFSKYTKEEIEKDLKDSGTIFISVSPAFNQKGAYVHLRDIANDIQGMWIDINSADFSIILEQFKGILTGTYVIEYTSPDETPSENRTVLVSMNTPGCVAGSASSSYISPGSAPTAPNTPPVINDLKANKASPQEAGAVVTWTANATDPDGDQVFYRFFLNDTPMTNWTIERTWTWTAENAGSYQVEAQVRDGKHAGPNGLDDRKSVSFKMNGPNNPPVINDLTADKASPQDIGSVVTWTANATDNDGDQVLYRFFLNDTPMTNWTIERTWTWAAEKAGSYQVETQVRDGKHAGPNGLDDRRSAGFTINVSNALPIIFNLAPDKTSPQDIGTVISWNAKATDPDGDKILYRFFLNDKPMTDWITDSIWKWMTSNADIGSNRVEVQVRDGKHAGPNGMDDRRSGKFEITASAMIVAAVPVVETSSGSSEVQQTSDGGYIIAGYTESYGAGGKDAWLIKTDAKGIEEWNKTFGGSENDSAWSVLQQTSDGGYIIAGYAESYGAGGKDAWLIKTDAKGIEEWNRTFRRSENDSVSSVQQTSDGGYIIAGSNYNAQHIVQEEPSQTAWLMKTDANGDKIWDKTFGSGQYNKDWTGHSVRQTNDGGYIVLVNADTVTSLSGPHYQPYLFINSVLIKTNSQGNELWKRNWLNGGFGTSIQHTSDGGYIAAGFGSGDSGYGNGGWMVKTNSKGVAQWNITDFGDFYSVQQTSDGGYIVAGYSLVKTDANGNVLWHKTLGAEMGSGNSVQQTNDGGYIISGNTNVFSESGLPLNTTSTTPTLNHSDVFLIKTDAKGIEEWNRTFGG